MCVKKGKTITQFDPRFLLIVCLSLDIGEILFLQRTLLIFFYQNRACVQRKRKLIKSEKKQKEFFAPKMDGFPLYLPSKRHLPRVIIIT